MTTLKDIAEKAGVNKSTVSRVLNGTGSISASRQAQIMRIAKELGYIPNESAKVLAGKKAKTIGIILPEIDCNYYARVVAAIETKLKENGYSVLIGQTGFDFSNEIHYLKLFVQKKVDGIILNLFNTKEFLDIKEELAGYLKQPTVFIEHSPGLFDFDSIEIDNEYGISLAISHLVRSGAKRIAYITEYLSAKVRLPAFKDAMEKEGMVVDERYIKNGAERLEFGGYLRMKELLMQKPLPDAVFASYDTMAQGAQRAMAEYGIKVPEDILLIGFDNIRESEYFSIPLTTVSPPVIQMGFAAVGCLLNTINNNDLAGKCKMVLKPELIIRRSAP